MAGVPIFPAETDILPVDPQDVDTGEMQQFLINWLAANKGLPGAQAFESLVISAGNATPTRAFVKVDTEAAAASDELDHLLQTSMEEGRLVFVRCANGSRVVNVRHNQGGAGNLLTLDGATLVLNNVNKVSCFLREGTAWQEVFRFYGSDTAAWRAFFGLGSVAILNQGITTGQVPIVDNHWGLRSPWLPASSWLPSTTNGATRAQVELTAGNPELDVLSFSPTVSQSAFQWLQLPKHWNNGTVDARFAYTVGAAVSTGVVLALRGVSVGDNEPIDVPFGTLQQVTDTFHGVANKMAITGFIPAMTIGGTPAEGKLTCLRVLRLPLDAADTTNGNAVQLFGVQLRYTANKLNDS